MSHIYTQNQGTESFLQKNTSISVAWNRCYRSLIRSTGAYGFHFYTGSSCSCENTETGGGVALRTFRS
jgi:hypothetical protein